jgi:hypothetical protein
VSYEENLAKLNRLREQARQKPVQTWKGTEDQMLAQIQRLENDGYVDKPPIDFGPNSKADTPPSDMAQLKKRPTGPGFDPANQDKLHKVPTRLARGTDTESHCKKAVQDLKHNRKKATFQENADGSATKTTTAGKKRKIGKDLNDKIKDQRKNKADNRADGDNFTVADLARELGMDAKVARAKLRRHEDEIKKLHSKGQDRWVFPKDAKKAITKILKPKA